MLNLAGAFGLIVILLLAIRTVSTGPERLKLSRRLDARDAIIWIAICTGIAALFWSAAPIGFLSDDFVLIAHAPLYRWRSNFTTGGGDGFYRPLVYAIVSWTWRWAGLNPLVWHVSGIALHAINSIVVYLIAWALGASRFACRFSAALFAVHATRPESALWIAGRFDLFATLFVLLALFFWIRGWDVERPAAMIYRTIALVAMAAGLLSKESAYAFPVMLLVLIALRPQWRRPAAYLPFFLVAVLLFAWRWHLVQGIGGYLTPAGEPEILSQNVFGVLKVLILRLWAILFFPVNWSIRPGVVLTVLLLIYVVALAWMSTIRVKRPAFSLALSLAIASVMPVLHLLRIGPDLEKSRYLYLPSAMFALLMATVVASSRHRWMLAVALLAFQSAALMHNFGAWEHASAKAEKACAVVADAARVPAAKIAVVGVPQSLNGVYFFANGLPECVELRSGRPADVTLIRDPSGVLDRARFTQVFIWDPSTEDLKIATLSLQDTVH